MSCSTVTAWLSRSRSVADPRLEQALLVLRRVVLEVLREVAELPRGLDRLDGGLAPRAFELGELRLEGGSLLGGEVLGPRLAHVNETLVAGLGSRTTTRESKGGTGGDRPRALRRSGWTRGAREGRPAAHRRRGDHVHLLPVPLGHRPHHGQGRSGAALGDDRARRASSSSTARRRTSSPTATATTSATARRPRSSSASPSRRRSSRCRGTRRSRASGAPASATARSARIPAPFLTSDCRGNLKRIQAEFEEATGLHLRAGTEPEMMWLEAERGRHARRSRA